jgi:hypothetical protein
MIGGMIKRANFPLFSRESDDTYIYYLIWKISIVTSSLISFLYGLSWAYQRSVSVGFFQIDVWHYNGLARLVAGIPHSPSDREHHFYEYSFVLQTVCSYPFLTAMVLLSICVPLAWLFFRANIDLDTFDLLHWNQELVSKKGGDPEVLQKVHRKSLYQWLFGLLVLSGLPLFFLRQHHSLEQSPGFFLVILVAFAWLDATGATNAILCFAIFNQLRNKRGPRFIGRETF